MASRFQDNVNTSALVALVGVGWMSIHAMYGLVFRNGYVDALVRLRDHGPHVLPGTDHPILTRFNGVPPLDKMLTLAGVMFSPVTDGSHPAASLFGVYFGGQLVPIFTVLFIEGLRRGNMKKAVGQYDLLLSLFLFFSWSRPGADRARSMLWGCAMQAFGYGLVMPIYAIIHLFTSPTAAPRSTAFGEAVRPSDLALVRALPAAMFFGYFVPTVMMVAPIPWNTLHQWLGGFWQGVPIFVALSRHLIAGRQQGDDKSRSSFSQDRHALRRVYSLTFTASAVVHWATIAVVAARWLVPLWFPPSLRDTLTFTRVFVPPRWWAPGQMTSMGEGIHNFFQYDLYVGSAASLVWAMALRANALGVLRASGSRTRVLWDTTWQCALAGPGGALVGIMRGRDEQLLA